MSRPTSGSLVGGVLLCHLMGFVAFLLATIAGSPPTLLRSFLWPYTLFRALYLLAVNAPALSAAGVMVGCSLFARGGSGLGEPAVAPVNDVVRSSLVLLLVLTLAYVGVSGFVAPLLWSRFSGMEQASLLAASYRDEMEAAAGQAEKTGGAADYRRAYEAANRFLAIDASDTEMREREVALEAAYIGARQAEEARDRVSPAGAPERHSADGDDGVTLLRKAQAYYDGGDFYSAHYYASLAQRSPEVRTRAASLLADAEKEITPNATLVEKGSPEDRAAVELARLKRAAFAYFEQGDWLTAYYRFGELAAVYPKDVDIRLFHERARTEALASGFMIGEATEALREAGSGNLLFAVDQDAKGIEVISIQKMVHAAAGTFFSDVEVLRFVPGRGVTLHLYARYGKISQGVILLNAIDPDARWRSEEPRVSVAADPEELTVALSPGYDPDVLGYIVPDPAALRGVPAGTLWGMRQWASSSGLLQEALDLELLMFFVNPALFLTLGLLALAAAWKLRARYYGPPPALAYASAVIFPLVMAGVWGLLVDAARLLWAGGVEIAGFVPAAVGAAAVHGLLLAVALVLLARSALE